MCLVRIPIDLFYLTLLPLALLTFEHAAIGVGFGRESLRGVHRDGDLDRLDHDTVRARGDLLEGQEGEQEELHRHTGILLWGR